MKTSILKTRNYQAISIIALLVIWTIFAYIVNSPIKIPSPYLTFTEFIRIITDDKFVLQVANTMYRVLVSYLLAFSLGIGLGILGGYSKAIYYLLNPIMLLLKSMPTMAVILLSLIWLGREISPILVCFLIAFPIIYIATVNAIRNIDKNLLDMAYIYKFSNKKILKHLYIPSIHSSLVSIAPTSFSLALKVCIAAEVLSQPKYAIGTSFQMEKVALNTAGVLAWAFVAIILAGLFEYLITKLLSFNNIKKLM